MTHKTDDNWAFWSRDLNGPGRWRTLSEIESPQRPERATLSVAASYVLRAMREADDFYDDPITIDFGMGSEMGPEVERRARLGAVRKLHSLGWTVDAFCQAISIRTTPKWSHFSGMAYFLEDCES